jgi:hypothetical protein
VSLGLKFQVADEDALEESGEDEEPEDIAVQVK